MSEKIVPILSNDPSVTQAANHLRELADRLERGDVVHVVTIVQRRGSAPLTMIHVTHDEPQLELVGAAGIVHTRLALGVLDEVPDDEIETVCGVDPVRQRP